MISSDDFPLFLSFSAWLRIVFIIAILSAQALSYKTLYEGISFLTNIVPLYINISLILLAGILVNEVYIISKSLFGTLIDNSDRVTKVTKMLDIRLYLFYCEMIFIPIGITILIISGKYSLYSSLRGYYDAIVLSLLVLLYWLYDLTIVLIGYYLFSYSASIFTGSALNRREFEQNLKLKCINTCYVMTFLTCGLFGGGSDIGEDIESVANVLTDLFHHEGLLDIVFTDIVAGVILLANSQRFKSVHLESRLYHTNAHDSDQEDQAYGSKYTRKLSNVSRSSSMYDIETTDDRSQGLANEQRLFDPDWTAKSSYDESDRDLLAENLYKYCIYSCSIYSYLLRLYVSSIDYYRVL